MRCFLDKPDFFGVVVGMGWLKVCVKKLYAHPFCLVARHESAFDGRGLTQAGACPAWVNERTVERRSGFAHVVQSVAQTGVPVEAAGAPCDAPVVGNRAVSISRFAIPVVKDGRNALALFVDVALAVFVANRQLGPTHAEAAATEESRSSALAKKARMCESRRA